MRSELQSMFNSILEDESKFHEVLVISIMKDRAVKLFSVPQLTHEHIVWLLETVKHMLVSEKYR